MGKEKRLKYHGRAKRLGYPGGTVDVGPSGEFSVTQDVATYLLDRNDVTALPDPSPPPQPSKKPETKTKTTGGND